MTVEEMLNRMTSAELTTWKALNAIEYIGPDREDLHAGIVASAVFNANRGRRSKAHTPLDHMPFRRKERENADKAMAVEDQVKSVFAAMMANQ